MLKHNNYKGSYKDKNFYDVCEILTDDCTYRVRMELPNTFYIYSNQTLLNQVNQSKIMIGR